MAPTSDIIASFVTGFERVEQSLNGDAGSALHERRRAAIERVRELGLPSSREEEWRFTSIAPLTLAPFHPAVAGEVTQISPERAGSMGFDDPRAHRLVFVDGFLRSDLSRVASLPDGVRVSSLAEVISQDADRLRELLDRIGESRNDRFRLLNNAFLRDGALIEIGEGVELETPIHLLFLSSGENRSSHPRTIIVAEKGAKGTVIEEHAGLEGERYFSNPFTDIVAAADADLRHVKLQHESAEAVHIGGLSAHLEERSTVTTIGVCFGSALVRNVSSAALCGEGAHCTMDGLYVVTGDQLVDNHTTIDHAVPNCTSHELYKGVLDDRGRAVFNGRILVRQDAQKTDSKQQNNNLLLSDDAVVNAQPQLEIFADDVKCTHGATVGQLDEDAIFYLRARGIGREEAEGILTYAFASDIIDRIDDEPARLYLDALLARRMKRESLQVA